MAYVTAKAIRPDAACGTYGELFAAAQQRYFDSLGEGLPPAAQKQARLVAGIEAGTKAALINGLGYSTFYRAWVNEPRRYNPNPF